MSEVVNLLFLVTGAGLGAGLTYFVQTKTQERAWKRDDALNMRDKVYGPVFRGMSEILESIELGKGPDWEIMSKLKEMKTEYLFYNMKRDLKNRFYRLAERLDKYQTIHSSTQTLVLRKIRDAVKESQEVDVSVSLGQVRLGLDLLKDAVEVGSITLEQAILQKLRPSDFVRTKKGEWGEDLSIDVRVAGKSKELNDIESLYEDVLSEMEGEPLYRKEKEQRKILIFELEGFLQQIEKHLEIA